MKIRILVLIVFALSSSAVASGLAATAARDSRAPQPGASPTPTPSVTPDRKNSDAVPRTDDGISGGHQAGPRLKDLKEASGVGVNPKVTTSDGSPSGKTPAEKAAELRAAAEYVLVHVEEFTREADMQRLKDAATAGAIDERTGGAAGDAAVGDKLKGASELLAEAGTKPNNTTGKVSVSKQGTLSSEGTRDVTKRGKNEYGGKMYMSEKKTSGGETRLVLEMQDKKGNVREVRTLDPVRYNVVIVIYDGDGREVSNNPYSLMEPHMKGDKIIPNPMSDTGGGRGVPGAVDGVDRKEKTLVEQEAERKRQVTLPGEDQTEQPRVRVEQREALVHQQKKTTDGKIDPNPNEDGATSTGGTPPAPGVGKGPERVDKKRGGKPGGPAPDDPTAGQSNRPANDPPPSDNKPPKP